MVFLPWLPPVHDPPTGEEHTPLTRTPTPVYDGRSIICRSEYIGFYDVYCWWQKWKRRRLAACTFTIFWWPRWSARFGIRCSDLCESKNQRDGPLVLREEQRLRLFSAYQSLVIRLTPPTFDIDLRGTVKRTIVRADQETWSCGYTWPAQVDDGENGDEFGIYAICVGVYHDGAGRYSRGWLTNFVGGSVGRSCTDPTICTAVRCNRQRK